MYQNYSNYISNTIKEIPIGKAIFTDDVAHELSTQLGLPYKNCKSVVNLNLKRLADAKKIERLQKGVYYKPKETVFGTLKPSIDAVIVEKATLQLGETIGYITGDAFLHEIGLTTLMPKNKEVATNKYRIKVEDTAKIILRKPPAQITTYNYQYFQFLDAVDCLEKSYIDADNPFEILKAIAYKRELDKIKLITLAKKYYPKNTLLRLLDIILED